MGWHTSISLDESRVPPQRSASSLGQEHIPLGLITDVPCLRHISMETSSDPRPTALEDCWSPTPNASTDLPGCPSRASLNDAEASDTHNEEACGQTALPELDQPGHLPNTHQAPRPSRLLTMPPELRNHIYTTYFSLFDDGSDPQIRPSYTLPPLLKTCRQIFMEAIGLYYSTATAFRCLDEDSTIRWLCNLPAQYLDLIKEVRYDTRWIIFMTPLPVPGAECGLTGDLVRKLEMRGFDVEGRLFMSGSCEGELQCVGSEDEERVERGTGKLRVSYYRRGGGGREGAIVWTDRPGLIESVTTR